MRERKERKRWPAASAGVGGQSPPQDKHIISIIQLNSKIKNVNSIACIGVLFKAHPVCDPPPKSPLQQPSWSSDPIKVPHRHDVAQPPTLQSQLQRNLEITSVSSKWVMTTNPLDKMRMVYCPAILHKFIMWGLSLRIRGYSLERRGYCHSGLL